MKPHQRAEVNATGPAGFAGTPQPASISSGRGPMVTMEMGPIYRPATYRRRSSAVTASTAASRSSRLRGRPIRY